MPSETTALGAGPLALEEEPQPDQGDEKCHRLREAHATTLLALVADGNRNPALPETDSESPFVSSWRKLSPMIVTGVDRSESARETLAWALVAAHSTMGHGRCSDADKAA
jgi:hypothetical protein